MTTKLKIGRRRALKAGAGLAASAPLWMNPDVALGANGTLTVGLPNNVATLDPINQSNHDSMAVTQVVFENLVEVDVNGEVKPMLAASLPRVSDNGLTWTFDLRGDVKFHNGQALTAEDVKYSFDFVLDPKNNALRRPVWEPIKEVVVESPTRVRFEMKQPYAPWLHYMTKYMGIFPKGSREQHGADHFRNAPTGVGTGPGIFVQSRANDFVEFRRNPNYWRKDVPAWEKLVFRVVPEDSVRVAYLMANEAQIISAPPPRDFTRLRRLAGIQGDSKVALGSRCFIATNNAKPPFDDVKFRRAMSRAIDRQKIAELFYGLLDPSTLPSPSRSWWFNKQANDSIDFDFEAAKKLLAESKYPNGASFDMIIPAEPYLIDVKDAALVVQAQLAKLNIKVNLQVLEATQVIREIINGNQTAALVVFMSPPDPIFNIRSSFYPGQVTFKGTNYKSDALIAAIDESYTASTREKLKPIMDRIQTILADDCPNVNLGTAHAANLWRSSVKGFEVNTGLTMRVRDVAPG
jgi:peptide/nickel transport system substrate-binding protein